MTDLDPRFAKTMFVVEATSFECLTLWREEHERVSWVQDNPGLLIHVGEDHGRPVCISVHWVIINDQYVMFYEDTSSIVNHVMVRAWLAAHCAPRWDRGTRLAHTNAMNFHHCMDAIKEKRRTG